MKALYRHSSTCVVFCLIWSIISTRLQYYDEDNITESRLDFRTSVLEPMYHGQDDVFCSRILYDMTRFVLHSPLYSPVRLILLRDSPQVQELGSLKTSGGRCIAFPNIYQHQIQPFSLQDKAKSGHRKIVALFLVNPDRRIPSTTTIAPQQKDWVDEVIYDDNGLANTLPVELVNVISGLAHEGNMSRVEAETVRKELMEERSVMVQEHTRQKFQIGFNMW